jgi:ubiquinone/menaquinone biosynthesis C-methylase UbiE
MSNQDAARHRAHMPEGTNAILNTRSLQGAHKRLAELLSPGMAVLDVGCGTGAITRGIAEAAAPNGRVIGLDTNEHLIEEARRLHGDVPGLTFEVANVYALPYQDEFDIVTAARVLQWLADPIMALRKMTAAARPGGRIVVLDYNHEKVVWNPVPPPAMQSFYAAFLHWRAEAGMDNAIADHLAGLYAGIGLHDIHQTVQHEVTNCGDAGFDTRIGIWASVAQIRGPQMVDDGFIAEVYRRAAEYDYREWAQTEAQRQTLYLLCVEGVRPLLAASGRPGRKRV